MKDKFGEIVTIRSKAVDVITRYTPRWPRIATSYTLIGLLILRDYDDVVLSWRDLQRASRGELSNISSLQRAIADARKPFLTEKEAEVMDVLEGEVHEGFADELKTKAKGWRFGD